ncbi:MAG: hypothetical protein HZB23_01570 [Deltaproteobacteria bacterium]|nr:hypothetical protein [Deltaproteobacteria bacterium]
MNKQEAIEKLNRQVSQTDSLKQQEKFCPDFKKWHRDTQVLIEKIFGKDTRHIKDFNNINYILMSFSSSTPRDDYERAYYRGLDNAKSILASLIQEIDEFFEDESMTQNKLYGISDIDILCNRFHLVVRQIRERYNDRDTLNVEDEYDVQDLFHALLCLFFDDIRKEEWTPSYAGSCSRVDFLLKQEETIIEIKKTRNGLSTKQLGEQLLVDIQKYQTHPSCKTLVCFVYDPDGRIANPRGIENDLNQEKDDFKVIVYIAPKGI